MPVFYNFTQDGLVYSFDDVFVPADLFREGGLWVWGNNSDIQLGTNNSTKRSTPVTTFAGGTNWKQVSAGYEHTAAIKTDGTLWVWGATADGQLGINSSSFIFKASTPVTTFAGGTNWKQVVCGYRHTSAIKTDGTLWVWGYNISRQLGTNDTTVRLTPVTTFAGGTNWKSVDCGYGHTSAIKTDGTLWSWGTGADGRLGTNDTTTRPTPVTTFAGGNNWRQLSCGRAHTSAIKTDGTLWVWGRNNYGQLGVNDTSQRNTPVTTFAGGTNWKQVSGGDVHTLAIKTDGTLWVWSRNNYGQLGTNDTTNRSTPTTTFAGGTNWKQVSGGDRHTSAIKTDGTLWVWGRNYYGKLGTNDTTNRSTPTTTFAGGTDWKQVSSGYGHTAAVTYEDPVL